MKFILAKSVSGHPFRSGAELYNNAIVFQMNPFVMISHQGDMMWTDTINSFDIVEIGQVSPEEVPKAVERYCRWLSTEIKTFQERKNALTSYLEQVST